MVSSKPGEKGQSKKQKKKSSVETDSQTNSPKKKINKSYPQPRNLENVPGPSSETNPPSNPIAGLSSDSSPETEVNHDIDSVLWLICYKDQKLIKAVTEEDQIQCDGCEGWTHRSFAGLKHHVKWKRAQAKGSTYFCTQCQLTFNFVEPFGHNLLMKINWQSNKQLILQGKYNMWFEILLVLFNKKYSV